MKLGRSLCAVAAALGAATVAASPAVPVSKGCGRPGYAYAGLQSDRDAFGVTATLAALADPLVERGHVAAWVGVGAPGEGPNGTNEWLQVGLNRIAGNEAKLYYEVARPSGIRYVELAAKVAAEHRFHVAVLETAGRRNVWRVWVDGRPVSSPIYLPASHGRLTPMAIAENWDGGTPTCNRYKYRFRRVSLAGSPGGSWARFRRTQARVMQDAGFRVLPVQTGGFVAVTTPPPQHSETKPASPPAVRSPQPTDPTPAAPAPEAVAPGSADQSGNASHGRPVS